MIGIKVLLGFLACVAVASSTEVIEPEVEAGDFIVGGRDSRVGQFPFMASLRSRANEHICGGVIISNRWLLSAAHCTQGPNANRSNVVAALGAHTRFDGQPYELAAIINHPRYNFRLRTNDICVLLTAKNIQFVQGRVVPARLPAQDYIDGHRHQVFLAGWGLTKHPNIGGRGIPRVLQWKQAVTISRADCRAQLGRNGVLVNEYVLCTSTPAGKGACIGDFGGPLINAQGVCVGVLSWGLACGTTLPDMYARVFPHIGFISGTTGVRPA